ncbi:MAG TPA: RMD1 family protein [Burkholderiales bacterium]|nr:RMD1 family protein [Burkholderiales bacterium]
MGVSIRAAHEPRVLIPVKRFRARALLLGARLDLRNWPEAETLSRAPLATRLEGGGVAVIFRYGVAVLFDGDAAGERGLLERLAARTEASYAGTESEELDVRIEEGRPEGLQDGALSLQSASLERLLLVAEALSKSVVLGHYEARLAADFERIEPLALELSRAGRIGGGTRQHMRRIGALLVMESRMVGRAEIGDKPELLWDHPRLEGLNALLEDEFEIRERLAALDRKLELAARTERTLADLISTRHALRVEWYIVGLIAFEIALTLYAMWFS